MSTAIDSLSQTNQVRTIARLDCGLDPVTQALNAITTDSTGALLNTLKHSISVTNSTTTPLGAGATFTGAWELATTFATIGVSIVTDQPGTAYLDNSSDGVHVDRTSAHGVTAADGYNLFFSSAPRCQYVRIRFTNTSASPETFLRLQTTLSNSDRGTTSVAIDEPVTDKQAAQLVKAILTGKDELGVYTNVLTNAAGQLYVTNETYLQSIAEGYQVGHIPVEKFGRVTNVNTSYLDVWELGTTYVFPAAAAQMNVVSTSASDTPADGGAKTVNVVGLDANYNQIIETVTLNGVTPVTTTNSFVRINCFSVVTTGASNTAVGTLTVKNLANTITYAEITPGYNRCRQVIYTVPAGYRLFLDSVVVGAGVGGTTNKTAFATFTIVANHNGLVALDNVFFPWLELSVQNQGLERQLGIPIVVPEKTDVKMTVITDSAQGVTATASWRGWLDPND